MADDYSLSFSVDFLKHELQLRGVEGFEEDDPVELILFSRLHCETCRAEGQSLGCGNCELKMEYSGKAAAGGTASYSEGEEYLCCLQFGPNSKRRVLLSLTPRDHDVDVHERALLARSFTKKLLRGPLHSGNDSKEVAETAGAPETVDEAEVEPRFLTATSRYLPNMQILYKWKKEQMTVRLPQPQQLSNELLLRLRPPEGEEWNPKECVRLLPGSNEGDGSLRVPRHEDQMLQVRYTDGGEWLNLLELRTDKRLLRINDARDAPRHLNLQVERPENQRGTFLLHVTFDTRLGEEADGSVPMGCFYLEMDQQRKLLRLTPDNRSVGLEYLLELLKDGEEPETLLQATAEEGELTIEKSPEELSGQRHRVSIRQSADKPFVPVATFFVDGTNLTIEEVASGGCWLLVSSVLDDGGAASNSNACEAADAFFCCPLNRGRCLLRLAHAPMPEQSAATPPGRCLVVAEADNGSGFGLDVDAERQRARLLPLRPGVDPGADEFAVAEFAPDGAANTKLRRLHEEFSVRRSCSYSLAAAGVPVFSFDLDGGEVANLRPRSSRVRLIKKLLHRMPDSGRHPALL